MYADTYTGTQIGRREKERARGGGRGERDGHFRRTNYVQQCQCCGHGADGYRSDPFGAPNLPARHSPFSLHAGSQPALLLCVPSAELATRHVDLHFAPSGLSRKSGVLVCERCLSAWSRLAHVELATSASAATTMCTHKSAPRESS